MDPGGLWDTVQPAMLGGALHEQKTPMRELDGGTQIAVLLMFELKTSGRTKTHGANDGMQAKFRLVIAMPRDTVTSVAIEVQEHTVKTYARNLLNLVFDRQEYWRPWPGNSCDPGIGVCRADVTVPRRESGEMYGLAPE